MPIELEMVLRVLLALVLGGIIGFQRGRAEKPAGARDLILISTGAALFTVVSIYGFSVEDQARVAAGIVTGIGFLGRCNHPPCRGWRKRFDDGGYYLGNGWHRAGCRCRIVYYSYRFSVFGSGGLTAAWLY